MALHFTVRQEYVDAINKIGGGGMGRVLIGRVLLLASTPLILCMFFGGSWVANLQHWTDIRSCETFDTVWNVCEI